MGSEIRVCKVCEEEFVFLKGKPGYVDTCPLCSKGDVPLVKAEVSWENKHTPIVRVTDAHTADRFNAELRRGRGGLIRALGQSARLKAFIENKGERKTDQAQRGWKR